MLNMFGLFIYKDEMAFKSSPQKPSVVVPLEEISRVTQREFSAQKMLKSQNATALKGNEVVYVIEISLKQNYKKIS